MIKLPTLGSVCMSCTQSTCQFHGYGFEPLFYCVRRMLWLNAWISAVAGLLDIGHNVTLFVTLCIKKILSEPLSQQPRTKGWGACKVAINKSG